MIWRGVIVAMIGAIWFGIASAHALDYLGKSLRHKSAVRVVASHLAYEQKRRVTQLHALATFDCQRRNFFGRDLGNEFGDTPGDFNAVLVELALPQQASHHGAAQLQLCRNVAHLERPRACAVQS